MGDLSKLFGVANIAISPDFSIRALYSGIATIGAISRLRRSMLGCGARSAVQMSSKNGAGVDSGFRIGSSCASEVNDGSKRHRASENAI
jgi:hypothetical protein